MKYYNSKGRNMRLTVKFPYDSEQTKAPSGQSVGCYPDPICQQQQLPLIQTQKTKILNASSVPSGSVKLSTKNMKYIEDLKKILDIVKQ